MGLEKCVWFLERSLFEVFPEETKEDWDNCGLIVGDKAATVKRIGVALDPTVVAIRDAAEHGCNVLLTHHPVFLKPPNLIVRNSLHTWSSQGSRRDSVEQVISGEEIQEAIRDDVALIAMHTNFDYSPKSQHVLPDALGLTYLNPIEQTSQAGAVGAGEKLGGLGQLSSTPAITLAELAQRCNELFGVAPRVWGDPAQRVEFVATCPGSAWPLINDSTRCEFDCFICGETRYHTALAAKEAGISVIELGHDVSERLFVEVLYDTLVDLGYAQNELYKLPTQVNWWTL